MFLPTTGEEIKKLGWKKLDVVLITGDSYIDSPHMGVTLVGKVLLKAGYRVGIVAQPDIHTDRDIKRLGEPELFWGVTSGSVDSMISNYTVSMKPRNKDDFTPGGLNTRRPDRAVIVYSNLIRRHFSGTVPIVLGGIEASLRRISHYDYWSDSVRRSILFDAKGDILVHGMGERTVLELAERLRRNEPVTELRGICYISRMAPPSGVELPCHSEVLRDKQKFIEMFNIFFENSDPLSARTLYQRQDTRYLVQNPPQFPSESEELDEIFELPYAHDVHPYYKSMGHVRALETIKFSITTHWGCYGECRFCAIAVHQGRRLSERTEASILREAVALSKRPDFKGFIFNVGGPTANMYGIECERKKKKGACTDKHCLFPAPCKHLPISHFRQIQLLKKLRKIPGVKEVFIGSGIRHDLVLADKKWGYPYLEEVVRHHTSGQLKVAPEHCVDRITNIMGKPGPESLKAFKHMFDTLTKKAGKKQFLTYYFIAAHPACVLEDMISLRNFVKKELGVAPEQVQIFTPSPSTYSTLMYYIEMDPFTGEPLFVEKDRKKREKQKKVLIS